MISLEKKKVRILLKVKEISATQLVNLLAAVQSLDLQLLVRVRKIEIRLLLST